ncbi:MAG: GGDEF domain-containing protein [Caldimonas sp.]
MSDAKVSPSARNPSAGSLTQAIGKSERIKEMVEECATELSQVNEILKEEAEKLTDQADVAGAVQKSEAVAAKVQDSADKLTKVNEALMEEVRERQLLEHQLAASQAQEHAARHAAFHDPLTSLPNRVLFNDRLEHGLAQAKRQGWTIAVMFIDLDAFKAINDSHGHEVGDKVLMTIASRLQKMTREDDTVSRHGGDEFLYLLSELKSTADATAIARKIIQSLSKPCDGLGDGVPAQSVKPSIGIALYPADAITADELVKCADKAMYRAKQERSGFAFSADLGVPFVKADAGC